MNTAFFPPSSNCLLVFVAGLLVSQFVSPSTQLLFAYRQKKSNTGRAAAAVLVGVSLLQTLHTVSSSLFHLLTSVLSSDNVV